MKVLKPLVVESFRHIKYGGETYKRRLRISGFTAIVIDKEIGTNIYGQKCKFVVLGDEDIKKACNVLGVKHKEFKTYFHIDRKMCSFK